MALGRWLLAAACMILTAQHYANSQQTCQPAPQKLLPLETPTQGFGICLFNSTNNLVTSAVSVVTNLAWGIQNTKAYETGKCYCRQDCEPSQIVCEDSALLTAAVNQLPLFILCNAKFSLNNGISQIVYLAERWSFYCYCPQYTNSTTACNRPPNPTFCEPPKTTTLAPF